MAGLVRDFLFVGIKGHAMALDRATGAERWKTKLRGGDFVHLVTDGQRLYATTQGEVFCVDGATGSVLWRNPLKGMGLGLASLLAADGAGGAGGSADVLWAQEKRRRAGAHAAAG